MSQDSREAARVRWAQLRFSIIGTLLTSPPKLGELKALLRELAKKPYTHPTRDEVVHFAAATIERWYYRARETDKPIVALERKVPKHAGGHPAVSAALGSAVERQYRQHPTWSYQLHYDNLQALARQDGSLGVPPSYPTVRRGRVAPPDFPGLLGCPFPNTAGGGRVLDPGGLRHDHRARRATRHRGRRDGALALPDIAPGTLLFRGEMNPRDIRHTARLILDWIHHLEPMVAATIKAIRSAQKAEGDSSVRAQDRINDLIPQVHGIDRMRDMPPEQRKAWRILRGHPPVLGLEAAQNMRQRFATAGMRFDQAEAFAEEYRNSMMDVAKACNAILANTLNMEPLEDRFQGKQELLVRFNEDPRLEDIKKHADDLDTALRAFAELVGASPESPLVSKVEFGSFELQMLLDPSTWDAVAKVLETITKGLTVWGEMRKAINTLKAGGKDVSTLEAQFEADQEKVAADAKKAALESVATPISNEIQQKVGHGTAIFTRIAMDGAEIQLLASGDSTNTAELIGAVNDQLRQLRGILNPTGTNKRLPEDGEPD